MATAAWPSRGGGGRGGAAFQLGWRCKPCKELVDTLHPVHGLKVLEADHGESTPAFWCFFYLQPTSKGATGIDLLALTVRLGDRRKLYGVFDRRRGGRARLAVLHDDDGAIQWTEDQRQARRRTTSGQPSSSSSSSPQPCDLSALTRRITEERFDYRSKYGECGELFRRVVPAAARGRGDDDHDVAFLDLSAWVKEVVNGPWQAETGSARVAIVAFVGHEQLGHSSDGLIVSVKTTYRATPPPPRIEQTKKRRRGRGGGGKGRTRRRQRGRGDGGDGGDHGNDDNTASAAGQPCNEARRDADAASARQKRLSGDSYSDVDDDDQEDEEEEEEEEEDDDDEGEKEYDDAAAAVFDDELADTRRTQTAKRVPPLAESADTHSDDDDGGRRGRRESGRSDASLLRRILSWTATAVASIAVAGLAAAASKAVNRWWVDGWRAFF